VTKAESQRSSLVVPADPHLTLESGSGKPRDGGDSGNESSVELSQFLASPWSLRARRRSGTAAIQAARHEVDARTVEILFEAKTLYYEAALGEAREAALAEVARDARSIRDLVARRVDVGEAPAGDLSRTRVEALRDESEARLAAAQVEGVRAGLNRFLLGALGEDFAPSSDLDPQDLSPPPHDAVMVAMGRNPVVRAALSKIEAARSTLSAERSSRLPGFELGLFREREIDKEASGAVFGLTIPLWNRHRGAIGIARADLAEAEGEAEALKVGIATEIERVLRRDRAVREIAVNYSKEILPAARETLDIARFSLEQGEASLLTWLEARRSYLEILRASYEVQLEAFLTRAELERLTGDLNVSITQ
jgi:cobalt-zinc-cadmium efflux system outer membrane protein